MSEFMGAVVAGIFLVFAVLVLLYKRLMAPFVNMGSLLLAPLGGADRAARSPAMRSRCRC